MCTSDGGQKCNNMSHGGVFTTEKEMLLEVNGQVPEAHQESSLHAEMFGRLTTAMVSQAHVNHHALSSPTDVNHHIDNTSLTNLTD